MPSPTRPHTWARTLLLGCATVLTTLLLAGLAQPASTRTRPAYPGVASPANTPAPSATVSPAPADSPTSSAPSTNSPTPGSPANTPSSRPGAAASPSISPAPIDAPPGSTDGGGGCGLLDFGCRAINAFFRAVVSSGLNPVFRLLARSILASPRVDQIPRVHSLWTTSAWIANTCFVLLVVLGAMLVMGHQSLQTSYTAKDIAPRLIVAVVASNANLLVIGPAIEFANAMSVALMGKGVDPAAAANTLKKLVVSSLTDTGDVFLPLLALVAEIAGLVVLFTFVIRIMLLVLLTAAAPLALACHALPQTEGIARLWWRALAGVLAIQLAQSLVLATALRVFFSSDQLAVFGLRTRQSMFDLVLVICLFYILARIPSWVSNLLIRGGMSRSPLTRVLRTIAALLIFRRISAAARSGTGK